MILCTHCVLREGVFCNLNAPLICEHCGRDLAPGLDMNVMQPWRRTCFVLGGLLYAGAPWTLCVFVFGVPGIYTILIPLLGFPGLIIFGWLMRLPLNRVLEKRTQFREIHLGVKPTLSRRILKFLRVPFGSPFYAIGRIIILGLPLLLGTLADLIPQRTADRGSYQHLFEVAWSWCVENCVFFVLLTILIFIQTARKLAGTRKLEEIPEVTQAG